MLRPLSDVAVAEVVADRLQAAGEPALLELAAHARGNPFLLVELLEGLREEGRVRVDDGLARVRGDELPRRLAESMRERLDRLSADACQVVRVAAVLGHRFTAEQLAAVLDRRPSQLLEPIEETLRMDLLSEAGDRLGFRHELLRQAVLARSRARSCAGCGARSRACCSSTAPRPSRSPRNSPRAPSRATWSRSSSCAAPRTRWPPPTPARPPT